MKTLQTTCCYCGHVCMFVQPDTLTVAQLEAMTAVFCLHCGSKGASIRFLDLSGDQPNVVYGSI